MSVNVAINGFGRIGRLVLRALAESGRDDIKVVAINDLGPVKTNAHLLKWDSNHGRFPFDVTVGEDTIDYGKGPIKVTAERDPANLPHGELGVDIVLECTGLFTKREDAAKHLAAGARRVIISALQAQLVRGETPVDSLADGVSVMGGAVLMLVPGYITDGIGLVMFLPVIRTLIGASLLRAITRRGHVMMRGGGGPFWSGMAGRAWPEGAEGFRPDVRTEDDVIEGDFEERQPDQDRIDRR